MFIHPKLPIFHRSRHLNPLPQTLLPGSLWPGTSQTQRERELLGWGQPRLWGPEAVLAGCRQHPSFILGHKAVVLTPLETGSPSRLWEVGLASASPSQWLWFRTETLAYFCQTVWEEHVLLAPGKVNLGFHKAQGQALLLPLGPPVLGGQPAPDGRARG